MRRRVIGTVLEIVFAVGVTAGGWAYVTGTFSGSTSASDTQTIEIIVAGKNLSGECNISRRSESFLMFPPMRRQMIVKDADGTIVGKRDLVNLGKGQIPDPTEGASCTVYVAIDVPDAPFYTIWIDSQYIATADRNELPFERPVSKLTSMPAVDFEN